jgi:hypothetical protein
MLMCKFCTIFRSLNVRHLRMVLASCLKYGVDVTFSGMTSLLNFIIIYKLVQTLLGDAHTDRQKGDLISLTLFPNNKAKTLYSVFLVKLSLKIVLTL